MVVGVTLTIVVSLFGLIGPAPRATASSTRELSTMQTLPSSEGGSESSEGTAQLAPAATEPPQTTATATKVYMPLLLAETTAPTGDGTWPMAGANPARTSWTAEEVEGQLEVQWYRTFEPYIPYRVQIIAAYGSLFISTSNGLYALDPVTGNVKWVYPTEMPLGHSPTAADGVLYVGGFDRNLHAVDATTGTGIWKFKAGAGFDTSPLVVNGLVMAGNRDGFFYAVHASGPNAGQLAWKFKTQGPIHYSAAYKDGVVYFASNDMHAYALSALDGSLVWKSAKLPGAGFHSWWPVVFKDYVIFSGSSGYRIGTELGPGSLHDIDEMAVYPNRDSNPKGTLVGPIGRAPGDWVANTTTIDTSKSEGGSIPITEYFEKYPWRRTYIVLNRATGKEYTTDFDGDNKPEYAPILWFGVKGQGNRYPPVVGGDGVLYQTNSYMSDPSIPGGQISGWQIGTPYISVVTSDWGAVDEPHGYAAGGNRIYWNLCCDRQSGSFDVSIPNTLFYEKYIAGDLPPTGGSVSDRETSYSEFKSLPGYNLRYYGGPDDTYASYGSKNGVYGYHGDQNPPIPYNGMVFIHRSNAVIAFGPSKGDPVNLPMVETISVDDDVPALTEVQLKAKLETEVEKILASGHLKPGFLSTGIFDIRSRFDCGDQLIDYWHHPADILYYLLRALPHLPTDLQEQTKDYLQSKFQAFPPYQYNHIGWQTGTPRETILLPPEVEAAMAAYPPQTQNNNFEGWGFAPHTFYTLWKYAQVFGGAKSIFDAAKNKLEAPPSDAILAEMPHVHNAFIAGYWGYLELEEMAGYPPSADIQAELDRLLDLRVSTFTKDTSDAYFTSPTKFYCRTLNIARNFMYLVPELAEHLRTSSAFPEIKAAIDEYELLAPYWFVSRAEMAFAEGTFVPLYDVNSLFLAKAWILQKPRAYLSKYIDVPAMAVGDLFYIDNLVSTIEAGQ